MNEAEQKRLARIQVSLVLLHELLHLPGNVRITDIIPPPRDTFDCAPFEIVVTSEDHPAIPLLAHGEMIPVITATMWQKSVFDRMELNA